MNNTYRICLLSIFVACMGVASMASDNLVEMPVSDDILRHNIIGSWFREKSAGVASVATYTIYHDDGTVVELIRAKIIFKKATGMLVESQWSIQQGDLIISPVRVQSNSDNLSRDKGKVVRHLLKVSSDELLSQSKDKVRKDIRATIPADVQELIEELSKI